MTTQLTESTTQPDVRATSTALSIAVIDDNVYIGESLERWLTPARGYRFLGAFVSTDAALARMTIDPPQVLLLDVDLPGSDSFSLLARLARDFPTTRVIMLSGHVRREYIERALDGGAAGYIVKDEGIPVIMELIKRALAGEVVLSPTAKRSLIGAPC